MGSSDAVGNVVATLLTSPYAEAVGAAIAIALLNPEKSLILQKPSISSATEGQVDVTTVAHGGGMRWSGPEDPAYRAVLSWINGARAEPSIESAGRSPWIDRLVLIPLPELGEGGGEA